MLKLPTVGVHLDAYGSRMVMSRVWGQHCFDGIVRLITDITKHPPCNGSETHSICQALKSLRWRGVEVRKREWGDSSRVVLTT
ncbi:hypothetical protein TNCV_549401 [Trichonephila clavipes]|nr:hypothetical protein TNCV_549401 [Trichonephila clavipes]